jgi:hypothetical protein
MRYKPDWNKARERLTAFWDREIIDRCCCAVFAYGKDAEPVSHNPPADPAARLAYWTDPERVIARYRRQMEKATYGGEAFPQIFVDLGAGGHAGFFEGAKYRFEDSVWFFPSAEEPDGIEFDPHSFLFERTLDLARAYAEDSRGDYIVSMPDCTGNADALSHLLGPEALLPFMIEEPEAVLRALSKIEKSYEAAMRGVYEIVKDVNGGGSSIGWMSTWAPGLHAQMQSDMSVMISNAMYEKFVIPELRAQCGFLDYPLPTSTAWSRFATWTAFCPSKSSARSSGRRSRGKGRAPTTSRSFGAFRRRGRAFSSSFRPRRSGRSWKTSPRAASTLSHPPIPRTRQMPF